MVNNYCRGPEGKPGLELFVEYDSDFARILFEENFESVKTDGCFGIYFFTESGMLEKPDTLKDIFDFSKFSYETIKDIYTDFNMFDNESREDMVEEISDVKLTDVSDKYLIHLLRENESAYSIKTTRGYSQGDYAFVIFKKSENLPDFNRLFWDCPVYARFFVDGEEYYLEDYLTDSYSWDREKALNGFKESYKGPEKDYVIGWLSDNLPEYPKY